MDWFKKFLETHEIDAERAEKMVEDFKTEIFPKNAVPKSVYSEKVNELEAATGQLTETKTALEELGKKAGSVEEYQNQIEELQNKAKEIEAQAAEKVASVTKQSLLKESLMKAGAHDDALDLLIERYVQAAELDESGALKDGEKLLEQIRTEKKGLFLERTEDSGSGKPANVTPPGKEKTTAEMTDAEYAAYFAEREKNRQTL